jgi:hypothetical protein
MTIAVQLSQIPTQVTTGDVSHAESYEPLVVLGGWEVRRQALREPGLATGQERTVGGRSRIRQALAARYAVYRLNRQFRRNQREFDQAMDRIGHDAAGQRELQLSWTLRS